MSLFHSALGVLLENQTLERFTGDALDVVAVLRCSRGSWGPFWREAYDIIAAYRSWVEYEVDQAWLRFLTTPVRDAGDDRGERGWYTIR